MQMATTQDQIDLDNVELEHFNKEPFSNFHRMLDDEEGELDGESKSVRCKCMESKSSREITRGVVLSAVTIIFIATIVTLALTVRLARNPVVVLVSLDGLGYKVLLDNQRIAPNLMNVASQGVLAQLIPAYPTKTWPNQYSIMTGLYPEHHGIVANKFYDPPSGRVFSYTDATSVSDPYFYNGTPFWAFANDNGYKTACAQFPACDVPFHGTHPTYWFPRDATVPDYERIQDTLNWLDLSADKSPSFISVYLDDVDVFSHMFGQDSVYTLQALRNIDELIGTLYSGIQARLRRLDIDLIIVSDHGFDPICGRIYLEHYINVSNFLIPELDSSTGSTPQLAIWANLSDVDALVANLSLIPNATVYSKAQLPAEWQYNNSVRIAPVHLVADQGFLITTQAYYFSNPTVFVGGNHGWDPSAPNMTGIFIGVGPSFPRAAGLSLRNVDLFNLFAAILDVKPDANDGDYPFVAGILKSSVVPDWTRNSPTT